MDIVSPRIQDETGSLSQSFQQASPFRHVVIDNFFNPDFCQQLLQDFPGFDVRYALNEMGQVGGKAVRMDVRDISDTYRTLDAYIQTPEFLKQIEDITGIPGLLYDTEYVGGGTHENCHGQGLDSHVDFNYHPTTGWHRRLNLIVYLNHEWEDDWGGTIEFLSDPWNPEHCESKRVLPLFNRMVIFETNEISWHGFDAIRLPDDKKNLSRRSFAIYLYTKERPSEERAASHATIYVPAGLPKDLKAGERLSETRIEDLRLRYHRMLSQLKFLYQRELDFSAQIASVERALAESRHIQNVGLQGYVIQNDVAGIWPDGWVSRHFSLAFSPTRKASGLVLNLWVPDALQQEQVFQCSLGDEIKDIRVKPGKKQTVTFTAPLRVGTQQLLVIRADTDWQPASTSDSEDARPLAWKLLDIALSE